MKIIQSYLTENPCYQSNQYINVKGLMLHSVGVNQPKADVFVKLWNSPSFDSACVHGFIESNGNVYQTLPWNMRGWHCGGSGNDFCIGVEMCEPSEINYSGGDRFIVLNREKAVKYVQGAYQTAVELFAYLCNKYSLNPITQIYSHNEGYDKGIATNHSDPEHLWKGLNLPYTMDGFRQDVKLKMKNSSAEDNNEVKYTVKITANTLKVYKSNDVSSPVVTSVKKGEVYTIVAEKDGWGKLKSGAGWINLASTEKYNIPNTIDIKKPYVVRIDADVLNVRKNADIGSDIVTTVKNNERYTIVDEMNGWGKLKSGAGWISLDYTSKE